LELNTVPLPQFRAELAISISRFEQKMIASTI